MVKLGIRFTKFYLFLFHFNIEVLGIGYRISGVTMISIGRHWIWLHSQLHFMNLKPHIFWKLTIITWMIICDLGFIFYPISTFSMINLNIYSVYYSNLNLINKFIMKIKIRLLYTHWLMIKVTLITRPTWTWMWFYQYEKILKYSQRVGLCLVKKYMKFIYENFPPTFTF